MDEIDEQIAKMRAAAEQGGAAMREGAKMLGAFRNGLIEAGFTIEEIIPLCITQLQLWWATIMADESEQKGND